MTGAQLATVLACAAGGAFFAIVLAAVAFARVPTRLIRTNVNGEQVPAILGLPVALAGVLPSAVLWFLGSNEVAVSLIVVALVLGAAGAWDDFRGAELPRGFAGHLEAIRTGRLTGGLVKLVAGGLVGLVAGLIVAGTDQLPEVVRIGASVALMANLINLLDRAPGRAGKVTLIVGIPLLALGAPGWALPAAGLMGALVAVLPIDLRERGMLGDAGANPLGGVLGLGLALSLSPGAGWGIVGVLATLNVASERISFSRVIERNPLLKRLDLAGRKVPD
jgi:UDP-N-acetylmuramyl pentapeptide phosphotransferase/UDP-N-acetylglucosamine-1-phosphate transferase